MSGTLFQPGFARRGGVITGERAGLSQRTFTVQGTERSGVSLGGSEHFALPQTFPKLMDVEVYLGWSGPSSKIIGRLSRTAGGMLTLAPVKKLGDRVTQRLFHGSSGGPDELTRAGYETVVVAETYDAEGRSLARAVVEGMNPYDFTAGILAWAADRVANVGVRGVGALGPVAAFGLDELTEGVRQSGIQRTE